MTALILDVGCGGSPKGDVNVDRFIGGSVHRGHIIKPQEISNFFVADACYLPFQDRIFDRVVSSHVIEHVNAPMLMLSEMVRVSRRFVCVRCPHRFTFYRNKAHVNKFCPSWFRKAFALLGLREVKLRVRFGLFGVPDEISFCAEKIRE